MSQTDWALRKPGATVHLVQRYTTQYWSVVARAGTSVPIEATASDADIKDAVTARHADGKAVVVCPLVSRHFDFLDGLWTGAAGTLPLASEVLHHALSQARPASKWSALFSATRRPSCCSCRGGPPLAATAGGVSRANGEWWCRAADDHAARLGARRAHDRLTAPKVRRQATDGAIRLH